VRAGRSRSSRPPETSAGADAKAIRALVTVMLELLMEMTLSEIVQHRKGPSGRDCATRPGGIIAAP